MTREGNPRWQWVKFIPLYLMSFTLFAIAFLSLWLSGSSPLWAALEALAITFAGLCAYALVFWIAFSLIMLLWKLTIRFKRWRNAGKSMNQ